MSVISIDPNSSNAVFGQQVNNFLTTGFSVDKSIASAAQSNGLIGYNPSDVRLNASGLPVGGGYSPTSTQSTFGFISPDTNGTSAGSVAESSDWRVRISLAARSTVFYKDYSNEIMSPLLETNGVIFPYTPTISVTHTAGYSSQPLTHSNYSQHYFTNSEVQDITIQGDFTIQNSIEGQYLLATIYFFRAATKMFFGDNAKNQGFSGNPPPMVFLNGYGSHYFPNVPCVISSFQHQMPPETDYISVPSTNRGMTRLPAASQITIVLKPVYSRKNLHDNFGLSDFAAGKLLGSATTGGFL